MNAKKVINALKKHTKGQSLPNLGLPESVTQALCDAPELAIKYIDERLNLQFEDKYHVGRHSRAFSEATGLTTSQVRSLNTALNLETKTSKSQSKRIKAARDNKEHRLTILDAVCDVITGMGSVPEVAETYGLTPRMVYAELAKVGKEGGFTAFSLRKWPTPDRRALARKVEKQRRKEIEEQYEPYI